MSPSQKEELIKGSRRAYSIDTGYVEYSDPSVEAKDNQTIVYIHPLMQRFLVSNLCGLINYVSRIIEKPKVL